MSGNVAVQPGERRPVDFDTRALRMFVAVAEELHFTRAARRVFVTQPTLSAHIRRLEDTVGQALFDRDARHVTLTPAGESFLVVAREVLRLADDAVPAPRPVPDRFRIAVISKVGFAREIIRELEDEAENNVEVVNLSSDQQLDALARGTLAVGWVHLTRPVEASLASELVRIEPLRVFSAEPLAEPVRSLLATYVPEHTIYRGYNEFLAAYTQRTGVRFEPHPVIDIPFETILRHLPAGRGMLTWDSFAEPYRALGAEVRAMVPFQPYWAWSLVWRRDAETDLVRRVLDRARQLRDERQWLRLDPASPGVPWMPSNDPYVDRLPELTAAWREQRADPTWPAVTVGSDA